MNSEQKSSLKWVSAAAKKSALPIIVCTVCNALSSLAAVSLALVSRTVIDIATGASNENFVLHCIMLFVIIGIEVALNIISNSVHTLSQAKLSIKLRNRLFPILLNRKYSGVSHYHSGDLVNRFNGDVDIVASGVISIIPSAVSQITKIVFCLIALFVLSPAIACAVIPFGAILFFGSKLLRGKYKALHKECQNTDSAVRSFLQECFQNIAVIKSFLSGKPIIAHLNRDMKSNYRAKVKRHIARISITTIMFLAFSCGYYAALVWGAVNLQSGLTYGTLMGFLQLVSQLRVPLQSATGIIPTYYATLASAERLIELENIEAEPELLSDSQLKNITDNFTKIIVKDLNFNYEEDNTVFTDINLEIKRNSLTAFCGESGCGKSTLFKLFLGLFDAESGTIAFDTGDKINASTRELFAYVPQGNMLLSGTIRDNVTFGRTDIDDEKIIWATKTAAIYDFIQSLPNGFDTEISERGTGLSEGQVQRIAIARALLCDTEILLLDESTSAIDEATEKTLISNLKELQNKTVLFITHRTKELEVCDNIFEMQNSQFVRIK